MTTRTLMEGGLPGVPAGEVLTLGEDGRYHHSSGAWFDASAIDERSNIVEPEPEPEKVNGEVYFYVKSVVATAAWDNRADDQARLKQGNYFASEDLARTAMEKMESEG